MFNVSGDHSQPSPYKNCLENTRMQLAFLGVGTLLIALGVVLISFSQHQAMTTIGSVTVTVGTPLIIYGTIMLIFNRCTNQKKAVEEKPKKQTITHKPNQIAPKTKPPETQEDLRKARTAKLDADAQKQKAIKPIREEITKLLQKQADTQKEIKAKQELLETKTKRTQNQEQKIHDELTKLDADLAQIKQAIGNMRAQQKEIETAT